MSDFPTMDAPRTVAAAPMHDAVEGEPVTVEATGRHIVITTGPQDRQTVVYLAQGDALALAEQILAADWLPDVHPRIESETT